MSLVSTVDFHVTSECSQQCSYCWGPQGIEAVDTETARRIVEAVAGHGARRIVFTGGDPLQRPDLPDLIACADRVGLEVAVSTTGDLLTPAFLSRTAGMIDLISLPLDGPDEEISSRTKEAGHFSAVMRALHLLGRHPEIDVKVATPVTVHNIAAVPAIVELLDRRAGAMKNRLFYNVFQAFPRSMDPDVSWESLVVSNDAFSALRREIGRSRHPYPINWLDHDTLDRLYVMIFPDGSLTVPSGSAFCHYGPFLDVVDLAEVLRRSDFDAAGHRRHARGWTRRAR